MDAKTITYQETRDVSVDEVLALYTALEWSSARKPDALYAGLLASHALVIARDDTRLIGLGNAISDGHLVVYFPHLLVHPEYRGHGIGSALMRRLMSKYEGFHQQALLADGRASEFYRKMGFKRAGQTEPMWIFDGDEHSSCRAPSGCGHEKGRQLAERILARRSLVRFDELHSAAGATPGERAVRVREGPQGRRSLDELEPAARGVRRRGCRQQEEPGQALLGSSYALRGYEVSIKQAA